MKIRFLCSVAGPDWTANTKEPIDLPDEEAQRFIDSGQAVAVEVRRKATRQKYEKAVTETPEEV